MKRFRFTFHRGSREEAEKTALEFDSLYSLLVYLVCWFNMTFLTSIDSDDLIVCVYHEKRFSISGPFPGGYSYIGFFEEINL